MAASSLPRLQWAGIELLKTQNFSAFQDPGPSQPAPIQGISTDPQAEATVSYKEPSSIWGGGHDSDFLSKVRQFEAPSQFLVWAT